MLQQYFTLIEHKYAYRTTFINKLTTLSYIISDLPTFIANHKHEKELSRRQMDVAKLYEFLVCVLP